MSSFNRRKAKNSKGPFNKPRPLGRLARGNQILPAETEEVVMPRPTLRRRGIYLLPNAFTTAGLFCGFYAIVMAMGQKFDYAAIAIFAAMVLDAIDGRVARLTNTQSEFGAQYDSLADMVSFGAAPALVVYCLLYTSPSPRDRQKTRMPSSA